MIRFVHNLLLIVVCSSLGVIAPLAQAATLTVTNGNDSGSGSLRDRVAAANDGDTIVFAGGINTVTLDSGQIVVGKSITITGAPGTFTTIMRSSGASTRFRVLTVGPGASISSRAAITLQNLVISGGDQFSNAGGAIFVEEHTDLTVDGCVLHDNYADTFGGAINITATSHLTMQRCTLQSNAAGNAGGAISILYGGAADIDSSVFVSNTASAAGAIFARSWDDTNDTTPGNVFLNISNSTLSGNSVPDLYGSAIYLVRIGDRADLAPVYLTATLTHVTVANNVGSYSILATSVAGVGAGTLTTTASVYDNPGALGNITNGGLSFIMYGGYNLFADSGPTGPGGLDGMNLFNIIPQLGALGDHGGPTQTILPSYTSAAVDAIPSANCVRATDQRGLIRPQGSGCDIGAAELDRIFADGFE